MKKTSSTKDLNQEAPAKANDASSKKFKPKTTYPMCMEYFEPYNVAIFGLVSREIEIHQLK